MEINKRVVIMREAITKIVPMLTQKQVKVTLRGMKAFVEFHPRTNEPMRVNLPYLPDDASNELIDAVQGFLDHEVGHILFSDPSEIGRAKKIGKTAAFLHNAIEDPMIAEHYMQEQFTGTAFNLSNVHRFFLDRMVTPNLEKATAGGSPEQITAVLMVPAIRAWAGQHEYIDYMADKWPLIKDWVKSVGQDLIDAVPGVKTSADACDLGIKMFNRIGEVPPPPPEEDPPPPPPPEPEEGEKGEPGDQGEPAPSGEEPQDGEGTPGENGEGGEPDEKGQPASGSEPGGEEPGEPGSEEPAPAKPKPGKGEEEGEEGRTGNPEPKMNTEMRDKMIAAINDQKGFDDAVAEALSERAEQECANSEYLIFTRDDDLIEPLPIDNRAIAGIPAMEAAVGEMLGPLTSDIERMISARSAAVWTGGHRKGRLHGASLTRVKFGRDDVFRQKQVNLTKDVAVELVVDCSGSMCTDDKIETASYSAYAIASILDRLGIANECVGFSTRRHSDQVVNDLRADPKFKEYCRYEALYIPIFKSFGERVTSEVRARFVKATISESLCHSNVDGESILIAATRLAARREARKILMVFSDGRPAVGGGGNLEVHLKAVVKQIEASGVDVVGLGIMDATVRKFYSKHIVMKSVRDLPAVVMGQLKGMLVQ